MTGSGWRRWALLAGLLAVAVLIVAQLFGGSGSAVRASVAPSVTSVPFGTPSASSGTPSARSASGLPLCGRLPAEVAEAVAAVRAGGPFLRPRNDGGTFGNRERLLPQKPGSYYREYTVAAPRERFPGPRRLVTGGQSRIGAEPVIWFYTADHYDSFCELHP